MNICIKIYNRQADAPCAICSSLTDPYCGAELFLEGTWKPVCHDCGRQYAPQLMAICELVNTTQRIMREGGIQ